MTAHRSISTLRCEEAEISLGDELRGARATSGRSLDQIERELKIKAAYLLAIEDGRPDKLPDPAYAAGFVRAYARYLGMDPEKTAARFQDEAEAAAKGAKGGVSRLLAPLTSARPAEAGSAPPRRAASKEDPLAGLARRRERGKVWRGLLGGIAMLAPIAFAGGILWGGWKLMDHAGVAAVFSGGEPTPAVVKLERPNAAAYERSVDAYWAAASDTSPPPPLPPLDAPLASALTRTAAAPAAEAGAASAAAESGEPARLASAETPAAAEGASAPPAAGPVPAVALVAGAPAFALVAERTVWIEIRDPADGNRVVFSRTLNPGERYEPPAERAEGLSARIGNPSGLVVEVGGERLGLFSRGNAVISGFALSPQSLRAQAAQSSAPPPAVASPAAPRPVVPAAAVASVSPPPPALPAAPVWNPGGPAAQPAAAPSLPAPQRVRRADPETRVVSSPAPVYVSPEGAGQRAFGSMRPVD